MTDNLDNLREAIKHEHEKDPFANFLGAPLRKNLERARLVAASIGVTAVKVRGSIGYANTEMDHVWLGVECPDDPSDKRIIDFWPVLDPDFPSLIQDYMFGIDAALKQMLERPELEHRLIAAEPPSGMTYRRAAGALNF